MKYTLKIGFLGVKSKFTFNLEIICTKKALSFRLALIYKVIIESKTMPQETQERIFSPYRLERLPEIKPYHIRARENDIQVGTLVYYGPMPQYYGIGEVIRLTDKFVVVDFRATGMYAIHQEVVSPEYLIPITTDKLSML